MKILFQGDSITDCHRNYEDPNNLGEGYVVYTVEAVKNKYPEIEFEFINRGISGNRTENLLARIDADLININPDIVTILLGVNDTWHRYMIDLETPIENFKSNYETILKRIKTETKAKLIMLEPFMLYNMDKDFMRADLDEKIDCVRKLALEYADAFIPLDADFVAATVEGTPNTELSPDGVHPGEAGKKLIANKLAPVIFKYIEELK